MNIRMIGLAAATATLAACATTSPNYGYGNPSYGAPPPARAAACYDCGTVTRIELASSGATRAPNATGAVLGGIVGAVAGHEISDKTGGSKGNQNVSAAAGAVAGAAVGNAIQNRAQANTVYNIHVRMDDGRMTTVSQTDDSGLRQGSRVRVTGGRVYKLR